jgi:hypothetical protein
MGLSIWARPSADQILHISHTTKVTLYVWQQSFKRCRRLGRDSSKGQEGRNRDGRLGDEDLILREPGSDLLVRLLELLSVRPGRPGSSN